MKITDEKLDEIYDDYCEHVNYSASEKTKRAYEALSYSFDEYISAVSEDGFKHGFKYAMEVLGHE